MYFLTQMKSQILQISDGRRDISRIISLTTFCRLRLFRKSFPDYLLDINWLSPVNLAVIRYLGHLKIVCLIDWLIDLNVEEEQCNVLHRLPASKDCTSLWVVVCHNAACDQALNVAWLIELWTVYLTFRDRRSQLFLARQSDQSVSQMLAAEVSQSTRRVSMSEARARRENVSPCWILLAVVPDVMSRDVFPDPSWTLSWPGKNVVGRNGAAVRSRNISSCRDVILRVVCRPPVILLCAALV